MIEGDALPVIDAPRVRLRPLILSDIDALFAVFSDPPMMRFWSSPAMKAREEAEALLRRIHSGFADGTLFQWGIERKDDEQVLGTCTLLHVDAANRRAEVGYGIASRYWRQGYMTEALSALIGYAFGTLRLRRLEADVDPRNDRSLRLLGKLGFRREGLLRERWNVGQEIQDTVFLGLLAKDWAGAA
jgi:RimJ/RimL family protein N-acetyltransferase